MGLPLEPSYFGAIDYQETTNKLSFFKKTLRAPLALMKTTRFVALRKESHLPSNRLPSNRDPRTGFLCGETFEIFHLFHNLMVL